MLKKDDTEKEKKSKKGKSSRRSGAVFELRVRADLESKGWTVGKWPNNISDFPDDNINLPPEERADRRMIPARPKFVYNPKLKRRIPIGISSGFPDFIAFKFYKGYDSIKTYEVIGVEAKINGQLKIHEREKCEWLNKNHIFSRILIARKTKVKNRIVIEYREFGNKLWAKDVNGKIKK